MIGILSNSFIPLAARGAAAGCLWVALLPDKGINQNPIATVDVSDCCQKDTELSQVTII